MELTRKTPEELTELARGIVTNRIYAAWDTEAVNLSFGMFLAMLIGSAEDKDEDIAWMEQVGLVYQDFDRANDRSINGYPTFFSAKFLHNDDRIPLNRECIRLAVALGEVPEQVLTDFDASVAEHTAAAEMADESTEEETHD